MDKGYRTFISFARGIQNGFKPNDFPLLDEDQAEKEYASVLSRFSFSMDVEKDILDQFTRGELDTWDAIDQLEDECNLSYDEACRRIGFSSAWATRRLLGSVRKRKRSKYHGSLVNNTFDDIPGGIATSVPAPTSSSIKTHPSIRYLVVSHLISHSKRHLVKSSLSGTLDTFLLQNYCAGLGSDNVGANIKDTGDNGRVELHFNTENSFSTYVDLGGSLGTGYVVTQIDDGLGLFPEGTEVGDLLDNAVVQEIVRSQGERDSGVVISSISSNVGLALDQSTGAGVVEVFFDLAAGVRDFNRLFGQYIQFVQGDVFQAVDRDSTKDSVRAKECLNDMSQCLLRVTNDCIKLRKCLGLGLSYSDEEVKEVNNNIVDLVGTWDQVEARFNNLSNPSDVLSGVFFDFQRTLREFSSSIDAYNLNIRSGTQLCSVRQALGIIQKRIQGLRDGWR